MTGWRKRQVLDMAREAGWMHEHDSETGFVAEAASIKILEQKEEIKALREDLRLALDAYRQLLTKEATK